MHWAGGLEKILIKLEILRSKFLLTVYVLTEAQCMSARARVCIYKILIIKPVIWYLQQQYICIFMCIYGNRNHRDLCLQGTDHLRMYGSQTDQNMVRILLFLIIFSCFIRHLVQICP